MLSFAAWRDETAIESSKDEVTQIAKSPEVKVVTEPAPAPQRAPFPRTLASSPDGPTPVSEDDAPVPGIDTTLPLPWSAKGPVPPVAASAPRGWRTGARLSWGRSQKLLHKRARTAWALAGFGLLVTCAAVGGSVLRSRQSSSAVRVIASVGDGETASAVGAAGTAPIGMPRTAGTGIGSESTSAQSLSHVPVVSVTDLPPAAQPPLSPSTPRVPSVTLGSASSRAKGSAEPVSHARTPLPMRSTASGAGAALANPTSDPLANPN
jgi:hypothetical protein